MIPFIHCFATKHAGPGQENIRVTFKVVPHQYRDEDTGVFVTNGESRLLYSLEYAHLGDEQEIVWNNF